MSRKRLHPLRIAFSSGYADSQARGATVTMVHVVRRS